MIADDLFSGAGGWCAAARQLDICARGIENMKEARATRDAARLVTIHDDVWTFPPDGKADGLIASPPCQTFSAAGKGAGRKALDDVLRGVRDNYYTDLDHLRFFGLEVGDERTSLVLTPLHFATQYDYEWLAWEQVPTVLPVWEACAEVLRDKGWHVWTGLLQAEMFGVPQTRKRAFLLASRNHEVRPPTPTHSRYYSRNPEKLDPGVAKWVSMAEALGWPGDGEVVSNYNRGGILGNPGTRPLDHPAFTVTSKSDRDRVNFNRPDYLMPTNDRPNVAKRSPDHPAPTMAFGHERPRWCWNRPSTTIVGLVRAARHPQSARRTPHPRAPSRRCWQRLRNCSTGTTGVPDEPLCRHFRPDRPQSRRHLHSHTHHNRSNSMTNPTDNTDNDDFVVRPFADWLREQAGGKSHDELSDALYDLVQRVKDTGKKGTVQYTIQVAPMKGDKAVLVIDDAIKLRLPEHDRKASLFYTDRAGNLTRTDPNQLAFESLREVPAGMTVDTETGELKEIKA